MTKDRWLVTIVFALCAVALGGAAFVFSGIYNVAATEQHSAASNWIMHTLMHRSVSARVKTVRGPAQVTQEQVRAGASEFAEMCVQCHGALGKERGEIGKGLNPSPPNLAETGQHWSNAEMFWILKNGIKMTGMPAFAAAHSDDVLWSIVAFVKEQLPQLTAEDYAKLAGNRQPQHLSEEREHAHSH